MDACSTEKVCPRLRGTEGAVNETCEETLLDDVERFIVKRLEAQQVKLEAHMAVEAKVEELLSVIG